MTFSEAHAVLAANLPETQSFNIQVSMWRHANNVYGGKVLHRVETEYEVWDGAACYRGSTLESAVTDCVNAWVLPAGQNPDEALAEVPVDC